MKAKSSAIPSMRPYFETDHQGRLTSVGSMRIGKPEDSVSKHKAATKFKKKPSFPTREEADLSKQIYRLENHMQLEAANDNPWMGYKHAVHELEETCPHPTDDLLRYVQWLEEATPIPNNVTYLKDKAKAKLKSINSANSRMKPPPEPVNYGRYRHGVKSPVPYAAKDGRVLYKHTMMWLKGRVPYVEDLFKDPHLLDTIIKRGDMGTTNDYHPRHFNTDSSTNDIPSAADQLKGMSASRKDEINASDLPYPEDHDDYTSYYRQWLVENQDNYNTYEQYTQTDDYQYGQWLFFRANDGTYVSKEPKWISNKPKAKTSRPSPVKAKGKKPKKSPASKVDCKPPRPKNIKPSGVRKSTFKYLMNLKPTKSPRVREVVKSVITADIITDKAMDGSWQEETHKHLVRKNRFASYV